MEVYAVAEYRHVDDEVFTGVLGGGALQLRIAVEPCASCGSIVLQAVDEDGNEWARWCERTDRPVIDVSTHAATYEHLQLEKLEALRPV